MNSLRKKIILIGYLSLFLPVSVFADIEDDYRRQQKNITCNYKNAQFYVFGYGAVKRCVSGEFWQGFHPSGNPMGEGVLNKSIKHVPLLYPYRSTITKYKIEGNDFVRYECRSTTDEEDFSCTGPITRTIEASRIRKVPKKSQMDIKFDQTSDKNIAYFNRGNAKFKSKDYKGAINDYTNAIILNPKDEQAFFNRGLAKSDLKDYQGAIDDYTNAIKLNPRNSDTYLFRALSKHDLKDYQSAIADYTNALKFNPKSDGAYNGRGSAKLNLKNYQSAISDFTNAIKLSSKDPTPYFNRGLAKFYLKDYHGAIADYTNALKFNPKDKKVYVNLGNAKRSINDNEGAINDYTTAIKLSPDYGLAYFNRSNLKHTLKDYYGACSDAKKAKQFGGTFQKDWWYLNSTECSPSF